MFVNIEARAIETWPLRELNLSKLIRSRLLYFMDTPSFLGLFGRWLPVRKGFLYISPRHRHPF